MYVAAIHSRGFRNLEGRFPLSSPLSVILGANNTGKSNLIDACRALFTPEVSPRARHWISIDDFAHDGTGRRACEELELEAEFADLDQAEQGRMVTCLSPQLGAGMARLRLRARIGANGRVVSEWLGGDSEHPDVERWAREAVTFTYLHPLRDAAADLRPGRDNRLGHLLDALAPGEHADRGTVEAIVAQANDALTEVGAISIAKQRIHDRFTAMTGSGALSQHSAIAFAAVDFGLSPRELAHLRRFLDVTKSALLFARGVILVEGVAEQLLLPALADQLDRSLATNGVTVVNIGGVAFNPFVALFGPDRLPYPCAVVSDADPPTPISTESTETSADAAENDLERVADPDDFDDEFDEDRGDGLDAEDPVVGDEVDLAMSSRAARLTERAMGAGPNVLIRLAPRTLEWDLVVAGNWEILLQALAPLRPQVTRRLRSTLADAPDAIRAAALLKAIKKIKGEFAQSLVDILSGTDADTSSGPDLPRLAVPDYLLDAITWVTEPGTPSILREAATASRASQASAR